MQNRHAHTTPLLREALDRPHTRRREEPRRYERCDDIHEAFLAIGCSLICLSSSKPRSHSVRLFDHGVMLQWGYARSLWLEARSANQRTQFSCSAVSTASVL